MLNIKFSTNIINQQNKTNPANQKRNFQYSSYSTLSNDEFCPRFKGLKEHKNFENDLVKNETYQENHKKYGKQKAIMLYIEEQLNKRNLDGKSCDAAYAIGYYEKPAKKAADHIRDIVNNPHDPDIKRCAAHGAGEIDVSDIRDPLLEELLDHPDDNVKLGASMALRRMTNLDRRDPLLEKYLDLYLEKMKDSRTNLLYCENLRHARRKLSELLGSQKDSQSAFKSIIKYIEDPDKYVRFNASHGIRYIKDDKIRNELEEIAKAHECRKVKQGLVSE